MSRKNNYQYAVVDTLIGKIEITLVENLFQVELNKNRKIKKQFLTNNASDFDEKKHYAELTEGCSKGCQKNKMCTHRKFRSVYIKFLSGE